MARWAEDDDFNGWVARLGGDESEAPDVAIDPADMHIEMPEIPIAGSGEKPEADQGPEEVDGEAEEEQPAERRASL